MDQSFTLAWVTSAGKNNLQTHVKTTESTFGLKSYIYTHREAHSHSFFFLSGRCIHKIKMFACSDS